MNTDSFLHAMRTLCCNMPSAWTTGRGIYDKIKLLSEMCMKMPALRQVMMNPSVLVGI
jgi:hypothetical protein